MAKRCKPMDARRYTAQLNSYLAFRELFVGAESEFFSAGEVRQKILDRTKRQLAYVTVYQILKRGEYNGLCWATWRQREGKLNRGERRCRVFSLTAKGHKFVTDFAEKLKL